MAETKDVSIIVSTLLTLLEEKKYPTIKEILMTMNPADIAAAFEEMEENRLPVLFRLIPKEAAAETFVEMEPDRQEYIINSFSDTELRAMLDELYYDDTADIIEEMPASVVKRILNTD